MARVSDCDCGAQQDHQQNQDQESRPRSRPRSNFSHCVLVNQDQDQDQDQTSVIALWSHAPVTWFWIDLWWCYPLNSAKGSQFQSRHQSKSFTLFALISWNLERSQTLGLQAIDLSIDLSIKAFTYLPTLPSMLDQFNHLLPSTNHLLPTNPSKPLNLPWK